MLSSSALSKLHRLAAACAIGATLLSTAAHAETTLTVLQAEAPRSMDPGDHTASVTATILEPMYDGLVTRDRQNKIVPSLATSWTTSEGGKVWTSSFAAVSASMTARH